MRKVSKKQAKELAALAALPDDKIDLTDFPEVLDWSRGVLRSELIAAHASCLSVSHARFLASSVERAWSESINSPRCAAS